MSRVKLRPETLRLRPAIARWPPDVRSKWLPVAHRWIIRIIPLAVAFQPIARRGGMSALEPYRAKPDLIFRLVRVKAEGTLRFTYRAHPLDQIPWGLTR